VNPAPAQVLAWVLSYDGEHAPEPLAITAAGAALALSGAPAGAPAGRGVARGRAEPPPARGGLLACLRAP